MSEKWLLRLAYLLPLVGLLAAFFYYGQDGDLSSDSQLYLFVGDNFWAGRGLLDLDGDLFASHGPVFPLLFSLLYSWAGKEAIQVAVFLSLGFSFLIGIYLLQRIFSVKAAFFGAILFLAVPFFWIETDKGSIDFLQLFLALLFVLALLRPRAERFILAGFLFGLLLLSKETLFFLCLAPLAWIGTRETKEILKKYLFFVLAALVTAGWWWVVVWKELGIFFPSQQLELARGSTVLGLSDWIVLALLFLSWIPFLIFYWHEARARLLFFAALASLPPTVLVLEANMDERQLLAFSFFSALLLAASWAGVLMRIKKENLVFSLSLLPLFLLLLFPLTLSGQKSHEVEKPAPLLSAVLQKKIAEDRRPFVLVHNARRLNMRYLATETRLARLRELDLPPCPCSLEELMSEYLYEKTRMQEKLVVLQDPFLAKRIALLPGVKLFWQSRDERFQIFTVDAAALPKKEAFYTALLP